jgi:REP element-mobilizing transposase RayT
MWNLPAPPGFQGLRHELPVQYYVRNLPHWRQDGATYFVTFRLADSLPQSKLRELREFKAEWERRNPDPRSRDQMEDLARETMRRVEKWLDAGAGSCLLRASTYAAVVVEKLQYFADTRYQLGCYVVMPNHVHVAVRPLHPGEFPLEDLIGSWKKFSAVEINRCQSQVGPLWQEEAFDRMIRDEEHLFRVIRYIGSNPELAGIPRQSCPLWINPEWVAAGWKFGWMD